MYTQNPEDEYLQKLYSQLPRLGSNQDVAGKDKLWDTHTPEDKEC